MDAPFITVGASAEAIGDARNAILAIVGSANAEAVKIAALQALSAICSVSNTTITSNTFTHNDKRGGKK